MTLKVGLRLREYDALVVFIVVFSIPTLKLRTLLISRCVFLNFAVYEMKGWSLGIAFALKTQTVSLHRMKVVERELFLVRNTCFTAIRLKANYPSTLPRVNTHVADATDAYFCGT